MVIFIQAGEIHLGLTKIWSGPNQGFLFAANVEPKE